MKWYPATGQFRYSDNWWLVLKTPNSIVTYYKFWVERFIWKKISTPLYQSHVTCLSGKHQQPVHKQFWGKYQGQEIEFKYSSVVKTDGNYFWLDVECPEIARIREELGLPPKLKWGLHLTIGFLNK